MVEWALLAIVTGLAVLASLVSIRLGVSVAIVEILVGVVAGNYLGVSATGQDWLPFLAGIGSVVLTFLAGAEIDPVAMRKTWKASASIGFVSFLAPFLAAWGFTVPPPRLELAGLPPRWRGALDYFGGRGLRRPGRNRHEPDPDGEADPLCVLHHGSRDGLALSLLFIRPNEYIFLLLAAIVAATLTVPRLFDWMFAALVEGPGEPEVKAIFFAVVLLGASAQLAGCRPSFPPTSSAWHLPPCSIGTGRSF